MMIMSGVGGALFATFLVSGAHAADGHVEVDAARATHAEETERPEQPSLSPRAAKKLDLTLHKLPAFEPDGNASTGARKPWTPKLDAGDPITGTIAEEKKAPFPLTSLGRAGFEYRGPRFTARIFADGSVRFDDKLSGDVTDLLLKARKEDPYREEKARFMAATAALRAKLTAVARADRAHTAAELQARLRAVWAAPDRARAERCEQILGHERDAQDWARAIVETFAREHGCGNLPHVQADRARLESR